jgi:hypothetical protein
MFLKFGIIECKMLLLMQIIKTIIGIIPVIIAKEVKMIISFKIWNSKLSNSNKFIKMK